MLDHQITVDEFRNFDGRLSLASQSNQFVSKKMYATWVMSADVLLFHVISSMGGESVHSSFEDAVTEYNNRMA